MHLAGPVQRPAGKCQDAAWVPAIKQRPCCLLIPAAEIPGECLCMPYHACRHWCNCDCCFICRTNAWRAGGCVMPLDPCAVWRLDGAGAQASLVAQFWSAGQFCHDDSAAKQYTTGHLAGAWPATGSGRFVDLTLILLAMLCDSSLWSNLSGCFCSEASIGTSCCREVDCLPDA